MSFCRGENDKQMKLNRVEKALMNNPVRVLVQRTHEAALMECLGGRVDGGCALGLVVVEESEPRSSSNALAHERYTLLISTRK